MAEEKLDSENENSEQTPNPGSDEARKLGCTCPVIDNYYGKGFSYGDEQHFYVNTGCPLHGGKE